MRKLMLYTAVVLATLATLVILWQFNLVLLLFVLSLFTAATIRPAVNWMTARGMARPMAQILLYVIGFGGLGLLLLLVGDRLLQEINGAINHLTIDYEVVHETWQQGAAWQQSAVGMLPPPFTLATAQDTALGDMLPVVMTMTQGLASAVGGLFLLLALSIYWSVDQHRFERLWLSVLPAKWRAYARDSWRETEQAVGNYLRTQIVQSLLAALLLGVGSAVIGIDYPILLAIFGAMAAFIPFFGGVLAAIGAFLLGSLGDQSLGLLMAGYTLLVFGVLELLVEPRLWVRERRSFLLTILVLIPLVDAFGFWGLLVAPALAAALEVVIGQAFRAQMGSPVSAVALDDLQTRYASLQQKMAAADSAEEDDTLVELQDLAHRLETLLVNSAEGSPRS